MIAMSDLLYKNQQRRDGTYDGTVTTADLRLGLLFYSVYVFGVVISVVSVAQVSYTCP